MGVEETLFMTIVIFEIDMKVGWRKGSP